MTPKQELFAQAYLETSNASEAYKRAYNTQANANTVNRKASQLLNGITPFYTSEYKSPFTIQT